MGDRLHSRGQNIMQLVLLSITNCDVRTATFSFINTVKPFGGRAPPGPAGELIALPRPPSWFQGAALRREGKGGEGKVPISPPRILNFPSVPRGVE
jgi:hypothetical protein